uniref:Uncharacterized protein n=1 Tax=Lepeophtheirus salmonis TaxID=72036 RepID=A0A0K2TPN3_LEPSM
MSEQEIKRGFVVFKKNITAIVGVNVRTVFKSPAKNLSNGTYSASKVEFCIQNFTDFWAKDMLLPST